MSGAEAACPLCWGLGAALREDRAGRLFAWPCPHGCRPPLVAVAVRNRAKGKGRAAKAARRHDRPHPQAAG